MKILKISLILVFGIISQVFATTGKAFTTEQWLNDLDFVVSNLKLHHPNLYYRVTRDDFNSIVEQAVNEIKAAESDLGAFYSIKKVIASIQDGHTQLFDQGFLDLTDLRFPFRLAHFSDGVFITVIDKEHEQYLGSRVINVNGQSIEEVTSVLESVTNLDSKFGRKSPALRGITFARVLNGLGLGDNLERIRLDLMTRDGERKSLTLKSIHDNSKITWSNRLNMGPTEGEYVHAATILGKATPLHLRKQDKNVKFYWFEHLSDEKIIYFQLNQVANQPGNNETFFQFSERFWSYFDLHENEIDKLVLDIRYNDGGNGRLLIPFINQIIKRDKLNGKENVFVFIGNRTYSAAVILMTELAVHTNAVFIGEPSASPFNFFSDMKFVGNLPNSGFGLGIASRQIDNAWSSQTIYFQPNVPAPFSSKDYFSGNDPALELVIDGTELVSVPDYAADNGASAALEYYHHLKDKYKNYEWSTIFDQKVLEKSINNAGYVLMQKGDLERAGSVFKVNTLIFPNAFNVWDSYAEYFYNTRRYDLSLLYYKKSIELNSDNENGKQMIERIKDEQRKQ